MTIWEGDGFNFEEFGAATVFLFSSADAFSVFNQVKVVIGQKNGRLCITHGWHELNKLYDLKWGAVVTIIAVQPSRFVMLVKNRYREEIKYPVHTPPLYLKLNLAMFPDWMVPSL